MAREYRHIQQYEKEILQLKEKGYTKREIGEKLGFSKEQIKSFLNRYRRRQEKLKAGIVLIF